MGIVILQSMVQTSSSSLGVRVRSSFIQLVHRTVLLFFVVVSCPALCPLALTLFHLPSASTCPLPTHRSPETSLTHPIRPPPEPRMPKHPVQLPPAQHLGLSKQPLAPDRIDLPDIVFVRQGISALHAAVCLNARVTVAEEIDELGLQSFGHGMRVDVYAEGAELDEQAQTDGPVEAGEDVFAKQIGAVVTF